MTTLLLFIRSTDNTVLNGVQWNSGVTGELECRGEMLIFRVSQQASHTASDKNW